MCAVSTLRLLYTPAPIPRKVGGHLHERRRSDYRFKLHRIPASDQQCLEHQWEVQEHNAKLSVEWRLQQCNHRKYWVQHVSLVIGE